MARLIPATQDRFERRGQSNPRIASGPPRLRHDALNGPAVRGRHRLRSQRSSTWAWRAQPGRGSNWILRGLFRSMSGVTRRLMMRTGLAIAARVPATKPSPVSLAPSGTSGSMLQASLRQAAGISKAVGRPCPARRGWKTNPSRGIRPALSTWPRPNQVEPGSRKVPSSPWTGPTAL